MAKTIVDLKETPPKAIPNLTQDAMYYFIKTYGNDEDVEWFIRTCVQFQNKKINKDGELVVSLDISKIRRAFAERFFPDLLKEKKPKTKTQSFMDKVFALKKK